MDKFSIHITHNDADAVGCALVASLFPNTRNIIDNTYFCSIGTQDDKLNEILDDCMRRECYPSTIILSDLNFSEESLQRVEYFRDAYGSEIYGFDHHVTNHSNEKHHWFIVQSDEFEFDGHLQLISAALIMYIKLINKTGEFRPIEKWKHYHLITNPLTTEDRCIAFNRLIYSISRYDTWTWKRIPLDYIKNFRYVDHNDISQIIQVKDSIFKDDIIPKICSIIGPQKTFYALFDFIMEFGGCKDFGLKHLLPEWFYIVADDEESRKKYYSNLVEKVRVTNLSSFTCEEVIPSENYKIAMFISQNNYINSADEYLYNTYDDIDIIMVMYMASNQIGLRTKKNINLPKILKDYFTENSGGHLQAAGGTVTDDFMLDLYTHYLKYATPLSELDGEKNE
jgi:oligoribonuclease NrnB/cAMP/cGMP phosphodiesterase (DHH superfamily)